MAIIHIRTLALCPPAVAVSFSFVAVSFSFVFLYSAKQQRAALLGGQWASQDKSQGVLSARRASLVSKIWIFSRRSQSQNSTAAGQLPAGPGATALAHRPGRLATIFAGDAPSSTVLAGMASLRGVVDTSASPANGSAALDAGVSLLLARPKPFAGSNISGGWPLVALVDFRGA